jgi:hypothetical protein
MIRAARQLPGGSRFGPRDPCRTAISAIGNEAAVAVEQRIAPAAATHGTRPRAILPPLANAPDSLKR